MAKPKAKPLTAEEAATPLPAQTTAQPGHVLVEIPWNGDTVVASVPEGVGKVNQRIEHPQTGEKRWFEVTT